MSIRVSRSGLPLRGYALSRQYGVKSGQLCSLGIFALGLYLRVNKQGIY